MAFDAKVTLNGKKYDALSFGYELKRDVDQKGRPSSHVYGGKIWVTVESTEDTNILEAMCSEHKPFTGDITIKKGNEDAEMKKVEFKEAYVVTFKEEFERKDKTPMAIYFELSAKEISCGSAIHKEEWPEG